MSTRHTPHLGWIIAVVLFGATACSKSPPTTGTPATGTPSTGTPGSGTSKTGTPKPGGAKGGGTATMPGSRARGPGAPGGAGRPVGKTGKGAGWRRQLVDNICADVKGSGGFASDVDPLADPMDDGDVDLDVAPLDDVEADACPLADGAKCAPGKGAVQSDDEIAAVLAAVHETDISEGDLAAGKAEEPAVRDYAKLMVAANTQAAEEDRVVWSRFGIQPVESRMSRSIAEGRKSLASALERARGEIFDRKYIRSQILEHRRALGILDGLLGRTRNAEVSCQIEKDRALVAAHLTLACFVLDEMQHPGEKTVGRRHVGRARVGHAVRDDEDT